MMNGRNLPLAATAATLRPNADLSIALENPELNDNNLSYTVKAAGGEMPEKGSEVSVFIDIIGMPFTPLSYVGVARRDFRRTVLY
jgi:hypothetical protein